MHDKCVLLAFSFTQPFKDARSQMFRFFFASNYNLHIQLLTLCVGFITAHAFYLYVTRLFLPINRLLLMVWFFVHFAFSKFLVQIEAMLSKVCRSSLATPYAISLATRRTAQTRLTQASQLALDVRPSTLAKFGLASTVGAAASLHTLNAEYARLVTSGLSRSKLYLMYVSPPDSFSRLLSFVWHPTL